MSTNKVAIGGDVTLTTLTRRGHVDQRVIHQYTAEDFEAMVAGTFHPWSQLAPCDCDSGARWVGCCISNVFDSPCVCGSGETFGDCCKVGTAEVAEGEPAAV